MKFNFITIPVYGAEGEAEKHNKFCSRHRISDIEKHFVEMARDWTLSDIDKQEISKFRKASRTYITIQLCSIRLYSRFLGDVKNLSPKITNYINGQLGLPPAVREMI